MACSTAWRSMSESKRSVMGKAINRISCFSSIQAAQHHSEGKTMVIARVPKHDETTLATALDAGAAAIIIPHCDSTQDVEEVMKEIYYRE